MRYEDVRRSRGAGLLSRLQVFRRPHWPQRPARPSPVTDLSPRDLNDIGVTLGFDRPVDWWRFR